MMLRFRSFCVLLEDRVDFVKKQNPEINSSHDVYATHRNASDIIDHFANHADPSTKKVHTPWIVNQYKKGNFRQEDHPRIKTALEGFDKFKGKLEKKDINQYKSLSDIENAVAPHMGQAASHKEEKRQIKADGAELVHSENGLTVHRIDTHAAAKLYGKGTKWCTTSDDPAEYNAYAKDGPLYVINTPDKEKYQFHQFSMEYRDARNRSIKIEPTLKKHPELMNVAAFKNPEDTESLKFVHPEEKDDHLDSMSKAKNRDSRAIAADSPKHAGKLVNDPDVGIRYRIAQYYQEHTGKMINDPHPGVRSFIAQYYPEHAGKMINDPHPDVRRAVAQHPEHAGKLVNDPDQRVRETAKAFSSPPPKAKK